MMHKVLGMLISNIKLKTKRKKGILHYLMIFEAQRLNNKTSDWSRSLIQVSAYFIYFFAFF